MKRHFVKYQLSNERPKPDALRNRSPSNRTLNDIVHSVWLYKTWVYLEITRLPKKSLHHNIQVVNCTVIWRAISIWSRESVYTFKSISNISTWTTCQLWRMTHNLIRIEWLQEVYFSGRELHNDGEMAILVNILKISFPRSMGSTSSPLHPWWHQRSCHHHSIRCQCSD